MADISYLLYLRSHHCTRCGNIWQTSDLYRVEATYAGRQMIPAEILNENSAFGTSRLQPKHHNVCFACAGELEIQRSTELAAESERRWQETLRRKAEMPSVKPSKLSGIPSLDDL